jgi:hypothetical protein
MKRKYLVILAISALFFLANIAISAAVGISKKQSSNPAPHIGLAAPGLSVKKVKQWNMQLVYQDLTSSAINYRISTNTTTPPPKSSLSAMRQLRIYPWQQPASKAPTAQPSLPSSIFSTAKSYWRT